MSALGQKLSESSVTARLVELMMKLSDEDQQSLLKELEERLFIRKRKHERKPYFSVVDYAVQDNTFTDFIQNISPGGMFIGTATSFSVGEEITLTFPLPVSREHIRITGEIVWASEQGIGVKFKMADHEQEVMIKRLVDMI